MTRTTPPRPLDVEAVFPELAAYRGTTTRLHPRPGAPTVADSSVGGPLLWPTGEAWPVCTEPHDRGTGYRTRDVRRARRGDGGSLGPQDRRRLLDLPDDHPVPMIALAQLYRRDVPDLRPGPDGADLLQLFACPFDAHGRSGHGTKVHVHWRHSAEAAGAEVADPQPEPEVVGFDGYVPEPCVLHPEQVVTYPFAGCLPEELCERLDAWEDEREEEAEEQTVEQPWTDRGPDGDHGDETPDIPRYQYDLSVPPGWRAGGYASWHTTDPYPMDCQVCATPMELLLTVDSGEWDGTVSWRPVEDAGLPPHPHASPTQVVFGRWGELNVFACPGDPGHPHRWSIQ
ncbi:hypothetical protein [Streptomyces fragilis]|uniref:DUF1963 domain-containing protein n=1 Tax=Streptomyces fragilis TaxID=67301 RepID=A0ABV2YEL1_9ACTN|nr:hypothetical protein [Streptomyces fragilis]